MTLAKKPMQVLLIDDDAPLLSALSQSFELAELDVQTSMDPVASLNEINRDFSGIIISDIRMPKLDGISLFRQIKEIDPEIPVIIMTGHSDVPMVLSSLREGVFDFFAKPIDTDELLASARRALESRRLVLENRHLKQLAQSQFAEESLIGETPSIVLARNIIREVAQTNIDVLLIGEFGTGKEHAAKVIHNLSDHNTGKFVSVNCGAVPSELINGELFGYSLGADPYSRKERPGRLEQAHQGTLYMSEIESVPSDVQGRLLVAIESQEVQRVGTQRQRAINTRLIAATQANVAPGATERSIRPELWFRINTVRIYLPPLRERRDDIPLLFAHYLSKAASNLSKKVPRIGAGVRNRLLDYDWPGNDRELEKFAESVVIGMASNISVNGDDTMKLPDRVERFEANTIRATLEQTNGDVRQSVDLLGIPRKTFYDKVTRHKIDLNAYRVKK